MCMTAQHSIVSTPMQVFAAGSWHRVTGVSRVDPLYMNTRIRTLVLVRVPVLVLLIVLVLVLVQVVEE